MNNIEVLRAVERPEDMSQHGKMKLIRQLDGDVVVALHGPGGGYEVVEFCASGGRSPNTLAALRVLFDAMEADNKGVALAAMGGQGVEAMARAMFEAQADRLAAPWDRQWEPTKRYWREKAADTTAPHQPEARVGGEVAGGVDAVNVLRGCVDAIAREETDAGKMIGYRAANALIERFRAAIASRQPTPPPSAAPEGMVLVPVEPTEAMLDAFISVNHLRDNESGKFTFHGDYGNLRACFAAAWAAVHQPGEDR